jgi:hypothetical protein
MDVFQFNMFFADKIWLRMGAREGFVNTVIYLQLP